MKAIKKVTNFFLRFPREAGIVSLWIMEWKGRYGSHRFSDTFVMDSKLTIFLVAHCVRPFVVSHIFFFPFLPQSVELERWRLRNAE
jgi:hypothetical protein